MRHWPAAAPAVACLMIASGCSWITDSQNPFRRRDKLPAIKVDPVQTRDLPWRGWQTIEQTNGLITLRHVPDVGGRTLSFEIGGDDAFLVFPDQEGKTYPADSRDASVHFGGHYACIGPELAWSVNDQPFNPHAGPHRTERDIARPAEHRLTFTSRFDTWKGATISTSRTITLRRGTTHVLVEERVTNRGPDPLDFYLWDFTQIDAERREPPGPDGPPLRDMIFYLPVPRVDGRKVYHSFLSPEPAMTAQFDTGLSADVLAIAYAAVQFKVASHAPDWWIAAVDRDTGWTYVKTFDPLPDARYVHDNGPIEVYGSGSDHPSGKRFVEMELLTALGSYPPNEGLTQTEHWYATICRGPVIEARPVGVVCERLRASRDRDYDDLAGRYGVFIQGFLRIVILDRRDKVLFTGEPILIDPRRELHFSATAPVKPRGDVIVLRVFDHAGKLVGELDRLSLAD